MRQKLIISSALIHRPECIVVDEPMVGLDPKAARLLKDIFRQFVERGGTILMSTHTLEVAEAMCDQIAIIQHGKIVAAGTVERCPPATSGRGRESRGAVSQNSPAGLRSETWSRSSAREAAVARPRPAAQMADCAAAAA